MTHDEVYRPKEFDLSGLTGISDRTLETHFKLYAGYVEQTNVLSEQLAKLLADGKIDREEMPAYSELTRRLGFEYNGMVLHEYYFGNLRRHGDGEPARDAAFRRAAEESFGRYELWKTDFVSVGKMRGVGWAICYQDPATGRLSNHWVTLHEIGNVAGFTPVLVMDVWEHAFILDYKPADRPKYIEAFFANVDWRTVDARLQAAPRGDVRRRAAG
ncbi:MAG TPA: Fe-Mn family superoxide dismutase [Candidatus Binatia bacterium]|nr:Fe-Mn family superoxide dismutase [Candidatus Binatia bacterium]